MRFKYLQTNQNGNTLTIGLAIAAVVVVGGVGFFAATGGFSGSKSNPTVATDTSQQTKTNTATKKADVDESSTVTTNADIATLMTGAQSGGYGVKCMYQSDGTNGIFYADGNDNLRFDTTIVMDKSSQVMYMIRKDDTIYMWSEGQNTGVRYPVSSGSTDSETYSASRYTEDAEKYHVSCQKVSNPASLFEVPADFSWADPTGYHQQ